MKYLINIIVFICSILLLSVGFDKFLNFIEPPCSLMNTISPLVWKGLGVIQILGSILIWIPRYRKATTSFFVLFMLTATIYHVSQNTYDIGGSASMIVLFSLLIVLAKFGKK